MTNGDPITPKTIGVPLLINRNNKTKGDIQQQQQQSPYSTHQSIDYRQVVAAGGECIYTPFSCLAVTTRTRHPDSFFCFVLTIVVVVVVVVSLRRIAYIHQLPYIRTNPCLPFKIITPVIKRYIDEPRVLYREGSPLLYHVTAFLKI